MDTNVAIAAQIVAAYVSNNCVSADAVTQIIGVVHNALERLANPVTAVIAKKRQPAVPVEKSVTPDFIVCLEDGMKFKMLKPHLASKYNLTPDEYRLRWNLPPDYPMVAQNYATRRMVIAKESGFGKHYRIRIAQVQRLKRAR